jgi:hypothetical protein
MYRVAMGWQRDSETGRKTTDERPKTYLSLAST